jgi:hypothetical protein
VVMLALMAGLGAALWLFRRHLPGAGNPA